MSTAHVFNTESPDSPRLLVSIPAAAHLLSVGRSTIYELIWRGELVPIKIGRCVRIRRSDLEDYVTRSVADQLSTAPARVDGGVDHPSTGMLSRGSPSYLRPRGKSC